MTATELSKKLIQLWQIAEWDSLEEFLSEDIELIILGIDPCIVGKNNVLNLLKFASKTSFSYDTKINKILADDNYAVIQLDSNRSTSFLKSPIPKNWSKEDGILREINFFKTAILLEWNSGKLLKITTIDTIVHPPDYVTENFISQY